MATKNPATAADDRMKRSYLRVIVIWAVTLVALYAFQEIFT
jgi:hypothetical protein